MLSHFETRAERWTFVGLALLLAALSVATVVSAATQIGQTWPGFVVWRNLVAPAISGPGWAGSPRREVVQWVDDEKVGDARELRHHVRDEPSGAVHEYTFRRGHGTARVRVQSRTLAWRDVLPVYLPYWIDGLAFFAVGLIVFYFRPGLAAARAALALGAILGSVLLLASDVFSAFWLDRLYFACESLTPGALLHFALCFPEEKAIARHRPWLRFAVYLPFVPLAVLQISFLEGMPEQHLVVNDLVYSAIAAAGLVSVASLVHTFLTSRSALARQQAKIVMAGVALAAFLPSLGILAIILLGANVPMNLLAPFLIVFPLSIGYAIARHDLFSVDRYLRTGVVYAALSLIVFLSYAGLVLAGETWLGGGGGLPSAAVPVYLLVVLVLFDPLRATIQRLVDRLFYRQAYSYRATVEATSRILASVLDSERIAATVLETLTEVMAIEWAVLLVVDRAGGEQRVFARPPERALEVEHALSSTAAAFVAAVASGPPISKYTVRSDRRVGQQGDDGVAVFHRTGAALVLPLRFEADPVGALLLGEKKSGAFYTDEDLQLLATLGNQSALALTNAYAYEIIRKTQAELVEAERLAAVGELASTVAHGIRNPLAGIRAAAQVAREDTEPGSTIGESLDDIISESDRLEMRIRSILDLTRPGAAEPVNSDVNDLLRDFVATLGARVPRGVMLALDLAPGLPRVSIDPTQVAEVLDILVVNAVEAMHGEGRLVLRSYLDTPENAPVMVAVAVADSGPGIEATRIARVFELFYTTKPTGTGVGLAMARRLVERQRGTIAVSSTPGAGTVFTLRLPLAADHPSRIAATSMPNFSSR